MDMGALIVIVGTGALIDALADINQGKQVVTTLLAASLLLLILSALGRATGQYGFASALAFLYLLASAFKNYQHVPMIQSLLGAKFTGSGVTTTAAANGASAGSPTSYSSSPTAGHLGIN